MNLNIDKLIKIKKEDYIIVGVSTGADSMALLHYLKNNTNNQIVCCHINHKVRKQSDMEEKYLKEYCQKNNIIFELFTITNYNGKNFENDARTQRYNFYEQILKKYKSKYLFLAHHGDDLIETIIMKIIRGSNLEGYSGIRKIAKIKDYYIIRPLLDYTKSDILKYNKKNKIKYYNDKTNKNTKYTRNRIRRKILPLLKKEDINIHKKFIKYSICLQEYFDYIEEESNQIITKIYKNDNIDLNKYNKLPLFIKKNILYNILDNQYNNKTNIIKEKNIIDILNIIDNPKPNISINLPKNIVVSKEYDKLYIKEAKENTNYKIKLKNYNEIDNHIIKKIDNINTDGNNVCRLKSKDLKLPLYIRNKKEKDIIHVKGLNGSKKVKDIFINSKIPKSIRNNYPILVDDNDNILWIPNLKKSKFNYEKEDKCDIILWYCEKEENNE